MSLKILCCHCRTHLYNFTGEFEHGTRPRLTEFRPATASVPVPQKEDALLCASCKKPWYMMNVKTKAIVLMTDQGWKPRPPRGRRMMVWEEPYNIAVPETPIEFLTPDYQDEQRKPE